MIPYEIFSTLMQESGVHNQWEQAREALDQVRKEIVSDPILTPSYSQAIIYIAKYWTTSNKLAKKYWKGSYKKSRLRK